MDSVFDTLEREGDFDRTRGLNVPPLNSSGGIVSNIFLRGYHTCMHCLHLTNTNFV